MGIIIHDEIETGFGITLTDSYASFHGQEVRVSPMQNPNSEKTYNIATRYVVFKDQKSCESGLKPLMTVAFRTSTDAKGIKNIFGTLYDNLAKQFKHTDTV